MNTRGLTEIVILTVGLQLGIIDDELFSMMVVMALVTTAMAGPLLALVYPRRLVERDAIAAQRAALGVRQAYRVLAVVPPGELGDPVTGVAAELAERRSPAEVVLSRLLPYPSAPIEIGSGLSGELLEMTGAMRELAELAEPVRASGLTVRVLAQFSTDLAGDLASQVTAAEPDLLVVGPDQPTPEDVGPPLVTVVAPPPAAWAVVCVVPGVDGESAMRVAGQLAAARGVELLVHGGRRPNRKVGSMVRELTGLGVDVRLTDVRPTSALVVATPGEQGDGIHLTVTGTAVAAPAGGRTEPTRTVIPEAAS